MPGVEARARYGWIREKTAGCVERPKVRPVSWTDRIDRVVTHRLWGTLLFAALMFVVFQAIFQGLGVAIIALALYAWAIRVLGDGLASLFMPLVPVFAVLLGVVVLGEVPAAVQVVGIATVTLGMGRAARRA